jgi:hypothetical protein
MASETRPVTIDSALILKDVRRTAMLLKDVVTDRVRIIRAFPCLTRAECVSMLQPIHMSREQRQNLSLWFDRNSTLPIAEVFAAMMRLASRSVPSVSTFFDKANRTYPETAHIVAQIVAKSGLNLGSIHSPSANELLASMPKLVQQDDSSLTSEFNGTPNLTLRALLELNSIYIAFLMLPEWFGILQIQSGSAAKSTQPIASCDASVFSWTRLPSLDTILRSEQTIRDASLVEFDIALDLHSIPRGRWPCFIGSDEFDSSIGKVSVGEKESMYAPRPQITGFRLTNRMQQAFMTSMTPHHRESCIQYGKSVQNWLEQSYALTKSDPSQWKRVIDCAQWIQLYDGMEAIYDLCQTAGSLPELLEKADTDKTRAEYAFLSIMFSRTNSWKRPIAMEIPIRQYLFEGRGNSSKSDTGIPFASIGVGTQIRHKRVISTSLHVDVCLSFMGASKPSAILPKLLAIENAASVGADGVASSALADKDAKHPILFIHQITSRGVMGIHHTSFAPYVPPDEVDTLTHEQEVTLQPYLRMTIVRDLVAMLPSKNYGNATTYIRMFRVLFTHMYSTDKCPCGLCK